MPGTSYIGRALPNKFFTIPLFFKKRHVYRIDREPNALKSLELKFWPKIIISECFDKIPEMFLFDVPFRVFRFSELSVF